MIELVKPDLSHWGPLTTRLYENPNEKVLAAVTEFYDKTLVPEMVCAQNGAPDRPSADWLAVEGRKIVITWNKHQMLGCWVIKDHGIYYACVNVQKGAAGCIPILRALAYKTFESEGTKMWASTENPLIQAWATKAINTPEEGRPEGMPQPSFNGPRVEWK